MKKLTTYSENKWVKSSPQMDYGNTSAPKESTTNAKPLTPFWDDDKVIDFVNWYIELHKLDFRYTLENKCIIESFKNGDDASKWHRGVR